MQNQSSKNIQHKVKTDKRYLFPTSTSQGCRPQAPQNYKSECLCGGEDTRVKMTKQYPISAIGLLIVNGNMQTAQTAFLIGVDLAMTAAKNIFYKDMRYDPKQLTYMPAGSENRYQVVEFFCRKYIPNKKIKIDCKEFIYQNDYAILKLGSPIGLSCGYFGVDFRGFTTTQAYLFGAPHYILPDNVQVDVAAGEIYGGAGKILNTKAKQISHTIPTTSGQDGSPLFQMAQNGDDFLVIGISHKNNTQRMRNKVYTLTDEVRQKINKWMPVEYKSFDLENHPIKKNHQITKQELKGLTENLQNCDIQILNLQNHNIGDEGLELITQANWSLVELNLNNTKFGIEGINYIASANWPQLKEVKLSQNNIHNEGCQIIANKANWPNLQKLSLEDNKITAKGIYYLRNGKWPYLLDLNLSKNQIGSEGVDNLIISKWKRLKYLWVENSGVSIKDKKILKENFKGITVYMQEDNKSMKNKPVKEKKEEEVEEITNSQSND